MIRTRMSTRRARIDRWIARLTPLCEVINERVATLGLGMPDMQVGPLYVERAPKESTDCIRRGADWFIKGHNTGFHVDFSPAMTTYEAWTAERRGTIAAKGKTTAATLDRDLRAALLTAGLNHLAGVSTAREQVLPVTPRARQPLETTNHP